MREVYRVWGVLLCVVCCLYCCAVCACPNVLALSPAPTPLTALRVLSEVQQRQFPAVDLVLWPPFVTDGDSNLSVVSVMRFMPWVRRLHLHDPNYAPSRAPVDQWHAQQRAKVVYFHQDLLDYALVSPFLAEHFLLLGPRQVLTNYVFVWQFFVAQRRVTRADEADGLQAWTRTEYNERAFVASPSPTPVWRARPRDQLSDRLRSVGPGESPAVVRSWLRYEELRPDRLTRPQPIVVAVIASVTDDLQYQQALSATHLQVWVHLLTPRHTEAEAEARLSFVQRMVAAHRVFIEVDLTATQYNAEKCGAAVMRQLHSLSRQQPFKVLNISSYDLTAPGAECALARDTAQKLARAYETGFVPWSSAERTSPRDPEEQSRLLAL